MKELDKPAATEVNGGLNPREYLDLPYADPTSVKDPRIEIDYNPQTLPQ